MFVPEDGITLTNTEVVLSKDRLGVLFSAEETQKRLLAVLQSNPDISAVHMIGFPFPPEIVIELHRDIQTLNMNRLVKITVQSDFSVWISACLATPEAMKSFSFQAAWFFERWEHSKYPDKMLDELHLWHAGHTRFKSPMLEKAIHLQLYTLNQNNCSLACAIAEYPMGRLLYFIPSLEAERFLNHIQPIKLTPKTIVPLLFHKDSPLSDRHDLILSLATTHIESLEEQYEIKALIAQGRHDLISAQSYWMRAIEHGSTIAYYSLYQLMDNNKSRFRILTQGAQKGCTKCMISLIFVFEANNMLTSSQRYLDMLEDKWDSLPNPPECPYILSQRFKFYREIDLLIEIVLSRRIELIQHRCPPHLPAFSASQMLRLYPVLAEKFQPSAFRALLTGAGPGLLKRFLTDERSFMPLHDMLFEHMPREATPNQGLLSMDPTIFANTLNELVSQYHLRQLPLRETSKIRCLMK